MFNGSESDLILGLCNPFLTCFFGMFLVLPVGKMILYAFQGKGVEGFTLANFINFFASLLCKRF